MQHDRSGQKTLRRNISRIVRDLETRFGRREPSGLTHAEIDDVIPQSS
jgi:hypothetical protein